MSTQTPTAGIPQITGNDSLAHLATTWAGASRVFHRYGFDFCCHGQVSVAEACKKKGIPVEQVLAEVRAETSQAPARVRWEEEPLDLVLDHLVEHFHEGHRRELPRLLAMAERVEHVHGDKADCPRGLAAHLSHVQQELEQHMQKEEQVLFPLLRAGNGGHAHAPIRVLELEHLEHGTNLERIRQLAHDFVPPPMACGTWRALYLGLAEFEADVMQHIHLENHVLFPRALGGRG